MKPCVVAIVPMRHESKRVVGKNFRPLGGVPLFCHIVLTLLASKTIDEVLIDTDSEPVRETARRDFPDVRLLERPEHLRADTLPMNDVLLHTTSQAQADLYVQTHSTNPFLNSDTIDRAVSTVIDAGGTYDSLFSVTRVQARLWDQLTRPINHNPALLLRTQDLPPTYVENSCLYCFTRQSLVDNHNRVGRRPMMFEIERAEAWDIDDETDFAIAELMYAKRNA